MRQRLRTYGGRIGVLDAVKSASRDSRHPTKNVASTTGVTKKDPPQHPWRANPRQVVLALLGYEGCSRVLHTFRHVLQWTMSVAILEVGSFVTLRFLVPPAAAATGALSPVAIHHGIAYVGMFGFLVSQLLYEIECLVRRLARIRQAWKSD